MVLVNNKVHTDLFVEVVPAFPAQFDVKDHASNVVDSLNYIWDAEILSAVLLFLTDDATLK